MADIFPFRAFRYNPEQAGAPFDRLVTQPYDKITPARQEEYYQASPYNLVRIILGKKEEGDNGEQNVYTRAAEYLKDWVEKGVLAQDDAPALYPYFQEYTVPGTSPPRPGRGERRVRKGFIALGRIEDYDARVIHRHELTHSGPKQDRLELLRHTRGHYGQLFMIYSDPAAEVDKLLDKVTRADPAMEIHDEYDVVHRVWRVEDTATVEKIQKLMAGQKLIIADGHHRYETAMAYRDECRERDGKTDLDAAHEKVMMTFINLEQPGMTILPTHRVIHGLPDYSFGALRDQAGEYFDWYAYPLNGGKDKQRTLDRLWRDLAERGGKRQAVAVYSAGEEAAYLFLLKEDVDPSQVMSDQSPRQRQLDLAPLHKLLLERSLGLDAQAIQEKRNIYYIRETGEAIELVDKGEAQIAFLVNATKLSQVRDLALNGEVLPQKSTDFYPKVLSGLTVFRLDHP